MFNLSPFAVAFLAQVPLEQSVTVALDAIKRIQSLLDEVKNNATPPSTPILLQATVDPDLNSEPLSFETSFGRELWFCCSHAVICKLKLWVAVVTVGI